VERKIFELRSEVFNPTEYQELLKGLEKDEKNGLWIIKELARRTATRIIPLVASFGHFNFWNAADDGDHRIEILAGVLGAFVSQRFGTAYYSSSAAKMRAQILSRSQVSSMNVTASGTIFGQGMRSVVLNVMSAVSEAARVVDVQKTGPIVGYKAATDAAVSAAVKVIDKAVAIFELMSIDFEVLYSALKADIRSFQENENWNKVRPLWWGMVPDWFVQNLEQLEIVIGQLPRGEGQQVEEWYKIESGLKLLWSGVGVSRPRISTASVGSLNFRSTNKSHPEFPSAIDKLNRQTLVNALAINLTHSTNKHHRAIGLLGEWGSGKTTVLKLLKEELQKSHKEQPFIFGEFNAWAYEHTDNIQAGVAQEMINALTSAPEILESRIKDKAEIDKEKTNVNFGLIWNNLCALIYKLPKFLSNYLLMDIRDVKTRVISFVVRRKLWLAVAWIVQRSWLTLRFSVKTHPFEILKILVLLLVAAMPWFTDWFDGLINDKDLVIVGQWVWSGGLVLYTLREFGKLIISPQAKELLTYLRLPSYAEHLGKIPVMRKHISTLCELRLKEKNGKTPRLLFVVDDLDRCSPEAIVKVLEAVRLVLDLENVIVIIAIDQHIALAALSKHFKDFAVHHKLKNSHAIAREYLSKVINLPIVLTAPSGSDVRELLVDLWKDIHKDSTVNASDAGREDSIDNTPTQVASDTNPPAADSKAPSDNVPVADGSPNPGIKADVKPKIPEVDQQPSGEINPIKALSPAQQQSFIHWVNYFELTNPRQIKRLNNSYDLMRSYLPQWDKEKDVIEFVLTEVDVLKVYPMLLTLILMEYLNSLHSLAERSQLWEKLFSAPVAVGFESAKVGIPRVKVAEINNNRVTSDFIKAYRSLLAAEGNQSLVSSVEAFVLPAMN
jgi:hypothetical protein